MELVFILVTNEMAGSGNVRTNLPYCINSGTDQLFSFKGKLSYPDKSTKSTSGDTVNSLEENDFSPAYGQEESMYNNLIMSTDL